MNLWLITVNYGDTAPTESLIQSLIACSLPESLKVAIADNACSIETTSKLNNLSDSFKLNMDIFPFNENRYYWPAAKQVLSNLKASSIDYPDWVMVCNNDITFPDEDFFKKLIKIDPIKFPIIGPKILNDTNESLNPFMTESLSWKERLYWWLYFISYSGSRCLLKSRKIWKKFGWNKKSKNRDQAKEVYAIHGSAILFSSSFFNKGGWLDDNFDLYGEELSVAEIAKKIGAAITYYPELKIIHHEHANTGQTNNKLLFEKARESHRYIQSTYLKK